MTFQKERPAFIVPKQRRGRRLVGIRYEQAVHAHLTARFGSAYLPSLWFSFTDETNQRRWCQPDGLLVLPDENRIIVIEAKYQHTANAWWQVEQLYKPVVREAFRALAPRLDSCEVVKWFDPAVIFPCKPLLCGDITKVPEGEFGVHIFKP